MADNYDKTLELFKKLQEGGATDAMAAPVQQRPRTDVMTGDVASLNEAVFGRYNAENDNSVSDGSKVLMETMKEYESGNVSEETRQRVENNVRNSKIPKAILESVLSKPLIETKINGSDVDEYMDYYNNYRPHRTLQNKTPSKFEEKYYEELGEQSNVQLIPILNY